MVQRMGFNMSCHATQMALISCDRLNGASCQEPHEFVPVLVVSFYFTLLFCRTLKQTLLSLLMVSALEGYSHIYKHPDFKYQW